jgi:hypothetical protein
MMMMMMTRKFIIISESVLADEDDDADHKKKTLPATVRARVRRPREKKSGWPGETSSRETAPFKLKFTSFFSVFFFLGTYPILTFWCNWRDVLLCSFRTVASAVKGP